MSRMQLFSLWFLCLSITILLVYPTYHAFRRRSLTRIGASLCVLSSWIFGPVNFLVNGAAPALYASSGCCGFELMLLTNMLVAFPVGYALGWAIDRVIANKITGSLITIATSIVAGAVPLVLLMYDVVGWTVITIIWTIQLGIVALSLIVGSVLFVRSHLG